MMFGLSGVGALLFSLITSMAIQVYAYHYLSNHQ